MGAAARSTRPDAGFALVVAVFAVVVIGALVTGGFFISSQQFRVGKGGLQTNSGLYAAEAGLGAALATWDPVVAQGIASASTAPLLSGQLPTGDGYAVWISRLDEDDDPAGYYLIRSVGNARGAYGGRRAVGLLVRTDRPDELCCDAAIQATGGLEIQGAAVSGQDSVPAGWGESCHDVPTTERPGVRIGTTGQVTADESASIDGSPPIVQDDLAEDDFFDYGDLSYEALVDLADHRYPDGAAILDVGPALDAEGRCERADPRNWGAPDDSAHPCHDRFPVLYATGNLLIDSNGAGQGILVVEGDLVVRGGFRFHGPVVVRGRLEVTGPGGILGGALVFDAEGAGAVLGEGAFVRSSTCAVRRAITLSKVNRPLPLARRAWFELLD
jgi:hypothetical protein